MNNSVFYSSPRLYWFDKIVITFFGGCPLASLGSGSAVARRSARPCGAFASLQPLGLRLRRPTIHPSAAALRAFAGALRPVPSKIGPRQLLKIQPKMAICSSKEQFINGLPDF